jgi:hypothetical protein
MKHLAELLKEFFTGVRIEKQVINNPFIENGPLILESRYYSPTGEQFGSGYALATSEQIKESYSKAT